MSWAMQELLFDVKYNHGIFQVLATPSSLKVPANTCINPKDITIATSVFLPAFRAYAAMSLAGSRAQYPMGYREMVIGGHQTGQGMRCGGIDQYKRNFGGALFEYTTNGYPGMAVMDGMDAAYVVFNPVADCGDAEQWERIFPVIYLGRRIWRGSSGYGKYRGGHALESLYLILNSEDLKMSSNGGGQVHEALGIMGGYPSSTQYIHIFRNTNLKELIEARKALPHSEGDDPANPDWVKLAKGESIVGDGLTTATDVKNYDLWVQLMCGAGGYGDPIDRDPDLVKKDLELELESKDAAEKVYCVKIDPETFEIDYETTRKLREARRKERLARGIPAKEYIKSVREKVVSGNIPSVAKNCINESLRISPKFLGEFREFWGLPDDFSEIPSE
jgi:acetone carboxylase alpha subunit